MKYLGEHLSEFMNLDIDYHHRAKLFLNISTTGLIFCIYEAYDIYSVLTEQILNITYIF